VHRIDLRHLAESGDQIISEGDRQQLASVVIDDFFVQRGPDALSDAALYLPIHDHRIDHATNELRRKWTSIEDEAILGGRQPAAGIRTTSWGRSVAAKRRR